MMTAARQSQAVPASRLSLIVPCFNEGATLSDCVRRALMLELETLELELIIVDDGSSDDSLEIARALAAVYPQVCVLRHEVNRGKGAALRSGFARATGEFVGVQDADLEYDPLDYLKLLEPLRRGEADVVFGSRYLRPENRRALYFWHSWMNRTLTTLSNMMTNLDISDMESCYKLFRSDLLQSLELSEERFGIEPEIVSKVAQARCRVWECAISYRPRTYEEGKKIGWKDGLRALYCILHYSAHTAPVPMQLLIYLFIGGTSAVANVACFALLSAAGLAIAPAVISSFLVAALLNYLLCVTILFKHKARWSSFGEFVAYAATLAVMGSCDVVITVGLTGVGLTPFASKVIATTFGFFGNFILRRYLVFPLKSLS
jgi:glycosyltransferase involved in cell wall biosynthesis